MNQVKELLFLHEFDTPCHLATLAQSVGIKVRVLKEVSEVIHHSKRADCFCLIPQKGMPQDSKGLPLVVARLIKELPIAVYQAERNKISEDSAVVLGVHGILYSDIGMDLLLTGIRRMLNGELWYDRKMMSQMLKGLVKNIKPEAQLDKSEESVAMWQMLTLREKTVIQLVSSGARNKEIAYRLCISEHTVKAHLSSIFRKTQSRNRVELLRWSNNYQGQLMA
ncbi:DNA-binding response regulator [Shewanella sp. OPT22]|nr:DNA-binding response regulator [Shewanella sp. OPT22]